MNNILLKSILILLFSFVVGKVGKFFINKDYYDIKKFDFLSFLFSFILWEPFMMFFCFLISKDFKKNKEKEIKKLTVLNQFSSETRYKLADTIFEPHYLYFMFEREKEEVAKDLYKGFLKLKDKRKNRKRILMQQLNKETKYRINKLLLN